MIPVTLIAPWQLQPGDAQVSTTDYGRHMLAEGDSWFCFGSAFGNGMLDQLQLADRALVTNLAAPGDTLARMAHWRGRQAFRQLVHGSRAWRFDAILLSAGGNDLIDALPTLVKPGLDAADCVNEWGWASFSHGLRRSFRELAEFVEASTHNETTPIYVHTYDLPTPRFAPALPGIGPWIAPTLRRIDRELWLPLTALLFERLGNVIRTLGLVNVWTVDTAGRCTPAAADTSGESGDWLNEIHPTAQGYSRLCKAWQEVLQPK